MTQFEQKHFDSTLIRINIVFVQVNLKRNLSNALLICFKYMSAQILFDAIFFFLEVVVLFFQLVVGQMKLALLNIIFFN